MRSSGRRNRAPRAFAVCALALLCAAATPASSALAGLSTRVLKVSPTTSAGLIQSGYTIASTKQGAHCEAGPDVIAGVYRCFAGNEVLDPCWALAGAPSPAVLCLSAPWSTSAIQLDLTEKLEPSEAGPFTVWGVQLASGQRCLALQGTHNRFKGRFVNYACEGRARLQLLGAPSRSHARWTIREVRHRPRGRLALGPVEAVTTVWYGLPSLPG